MKILIFARALTVGGSERQLALVARGLAQHGYDIEVVVLYGGGTFEAVLRDTGVRLVSLEKKGRWHFFGPSIDLVRILLRERPDVLYAFLPTQTTLAAILLPPWLPTKLVFGLRSAGMEMEKYDRLSAFFAWLEARLSRRADLIIANAEAVRVDGIRRGMPQEKITVIPNGIDTTLMRREDGARERCRKEWSFQNDHFVIGIVARLDPMKDHDTFLTAAAGLAREQDDVRFVCVGDGAPEYRESLKTRACDLGLSNRLVWAGERSDLATVYSALDVATLSSAFGEGFPNVIGEAMACGVPVVSTDVGDSKTVIGDCGIIVPPRRPDCLKTAWAEMRRRLSTEEKELRTASRARIVEHFSLDKMIAKTAAALHNLDT